MWFSFVFFFSSRRRHTRLQGDWSSDVCSSDLLDQHGAAEQKAVDDRDQGHHRGQGVANGVANERSFRKAAHATVADEVAVQDRSEERRVGKEWRGREWR